MPVRLPLARHRLLCLLAVLFTSATVGCGGGMPLWYGPKAGSRRGDTHFGGGVSASFLAFGTASALRQAQRLEADGQAPLPTNPRAGDPAFTPGALALAAAAPGIAPGVTARADLGSQFEAGLLYTGRSGRIDLRRSFDLKEGRYASVGLAAFAHVPGQPDRNTLASVAVQSIRGYGAELPALIGVVNESNTLGAWGGLRAGGEWVHLTRISSEPKDVGFGLDPVPLEATRFYAGPTFGATVGYKRFHLVAELMASFETLQGRYGTAEGSVRGLTLTPSTAILFDF